MTPETLQSVLAARAAGRTILLATRLSDGAQLLLPDPAAPAPLQSVAADALGADEAQTIECGAERWLVQIEAPPPRLLIIGAVHIAQSLAPMAALCGYAPTIIDPRSSFATAERFPDMLLVDAWPDEALATLAPDGRTAIVALSHDPKLDDPALDAALRSQSFYVGALGSRKSHASRLRRLAALGHAPATLGRIRGPVGLAIGARTAPEIALSVLAEMTAARRGAEIGIRK